MSPSETAELAALLGQLGLRSSGIAFTSSASLNSAEAAPCEAPALANGKLVSHDITSCYGRLLCHVHRKPHK